MALFGEKYGEWVRVVEVDGVSRELCGGTHVANTAEVGIFKIASEGSSAANVRRVEAITGPAAIDWFREREAQLREAGELLGTPQDPLAGARRAAEQLKEAGAGAEQAQREQLGERGRARWPAARDELSGGDRTARRGRRRRELPANQKQLLDLANRVQSKLGGASAVVLGGAVGDKVGLVALVSKDAVERGLSAGGDRPRGRAVVGGGGGGRDDMAQAGGKDPSKLDEALAARPRRRSSGSSAEAHARARPRPRHRPDRLRALRPERHPGDAAAGDRAAGGARGRRAGRRARGRAGRRRPAAAPQRRGGQPGRPRPQLLRANWKRCSRSRSRPTTSA